jgi:RNA polymerase sigma factor (TIGR02999 family)
MVAERTALANEPSLATLLEAAEHGGKPAADALFAALYSELRRLAKCELARHGVPMSLSATTLLHRAYIEIAGRDETSFADRNRFMGYAARVMRCLIIDHARSRQALKRGGQFEITSLGNEIENTADHRELSQIGAALDELAKAEPALAEVVDLKFFCGFSFIEIAEMRGVSERTIQRQWEKARIYLHRSVRPDFEM